MIFGINTTGDISKFSPISLAKPLVKLRITILKYHSWYLWQISLQTYTNYPKIDGYIKEKSHFL